MQKSVSSCQSVNLQLSQAQAAEELWVFYRDNKAQLHSSVRDYKDALLAQLITGMPVAQVFAPFILPPEPVVKPIRKARTA